VDDLRGAGTVAAFPVWVVLLDQPLVRLLDRRAVGPGVEAKNGKSGDTATHDQPV
jgi:hypothetical protein